MITLTVKGTELCLIPPYKLQLNDVSGVLA